MTYQASIPALMHQWKYRGEHWIGTKEDLSEFDEVDPDARTSAGDAGISVRDIPSPLMASTMTPTRRRPSRRLRHGKLSGDRPDTGSSELAPRSRRIRYTADLTSFPK